MHVESFRSESPGQWGDEAPGGLGAKADMVLLFASRARLEDPSLFADLKARYPNARFAGCSTAGEIHDIEVSDESASVVAVSFEHTQVRSISLPVEGQGGSEAMGAKLAEGLMAPGLRHVFVLSDGQAVNGSDLVSGLCASLPEGVSVTGGLAGDGANFTKTLVVTEDGAQSGMVCAVGLYGDRLRVGYGSQGGWDPFGPERVITRAEGNVLYELDHRPALSVYKHYLGEHAAGLPATGLLFPLTIRTRDDDTALVRTILNVDEAAGSLIFAGDMPMGAYARMMKANFDRLVDGASRAALNCAAGLEQKNASLSILISCVGRKLVLKQRIEEEVEGVRDILGDGPVLTGFYSYGEICPFGADGRSELHNQTMTITALSEV